MFNDKRERSKSFDVTQDSTGLPRGSESQAPRQNHQLKSKLKTLSRLGLGVSITALAAVSFLGMAPSQIAHAGSVNKSYNGISYTDFTTYFSELKKDGYVNTQDWSDIPTSKNVRAQFYPTFNKKTKVDFTAGSRVGSISPAAGVSAAMVKNKKGSAVYYHNVGKFNGKVVSMSITLMGKPYGQKGVNTIYFFTNKLGLSLPKNPGKGYTYADTKGIYNSDTTATSKKKNLHKVTGVSTQTTGATFHIHLYYEKSKKSIPLDDENQVGINFMEMESPWFHVAGNGIHYSYAQRILSFSKPTMAGNYGGTKASSADMSLAKRHVFGIKKSTVIKRSAMNTLQDFKGGDPQQSVMAKYKNATISFAWRGHAPRSDILEINGGKYKVKKPKTPKQPAPKKYVGPQSGKPSTYSATKSALADYTKTFTWKIQQKTKKAAYSGKGYTITDTLPGGTTIASITAPKGWTYTKSGNKVTFKATANVYKAAKTYNFYVASQTTKAQAMKHTSFNNHVTSKRKVSSSKWQTKNSNTAKWTLKNEQIKGYFIDFDHHDHAVTQAVAEHVKKVFRRGELGVLPLP